MLEYEFFRYALASLAVVSVACGVLGAYIVARRLVSIAGGITHACFGGLGLAYYLGWPPMVGAGVFAVAAALLVERLGRLRRLREDSLTAAVWALGMALGVLFIFLTPGFVPELNAFLFGNVLTVGAADLVAFSVYTALLVAFVAWRWRLIVACAFDPDFARVRRLPVRLVSLVMTLFVAVGIVLTIRLIGVMLLMAMMTLPQMAAETFTRRMTTLTVLSALLALACSMGGLALATVVDVPCSALIVLVQCVVLAACRAVGSIMERRSAQKLAQQ